MLQLRSLVGDYERELKTISEIKFEYIKIGKKKNNYLEIFKKKKN